MKSVIHLKDFLTTVLISLVTLCSNAESIPKLVPFKNLNKDRVNLGRILFHDKRLSKDNTISCSSCHIIKEGGDDNIPVSVGVDGQKSSLNSPSILYAALNFKQFWDGRVDDLETQVLSPLQNPNEMGSNLVELLAKLKQDKQMVEYFKKAFNEPISIKNFAISLSDFIKSLAKPNSKFDKYLDKKLDLSRAEKKGYKKFVEFGCIACHQGQAIGGNMYQQLGVIKSYFSEKEKYLKKNQGLYSLTKDKDDLNVFKVPSLRNVTVTAPYLHDGSIQNLAEMLKIMGRHQLGIEINHQDINDIINFLGTLKSESGPQ